MKKRIMSFAVVLLLIISFAAPTMAYENYGLVYDDTGLLNYDYMDNLSSDTLKEIGDANEMEVRVDIVTDLEGYTIEEYAENFYDMYDYGYSGNGNCILLMILVHEDETGLVCDDYIIYTGGECSDIFDNDTLAVLKGDLDEYLSPSAWEGDMESDNTVCAEALDTYAKYVSDILNGNMPVAESADKSSAAVSGFTAVPGDSVDVCVWDEAGILSESELRELNDMAIASSEKYGCGIYIVIVNDYRDYNGNSVYDAATTVYQSKNLGMGEGKDGILLFMSMNDRDYSLICYGDSANYAFCDYAKDSLTDMFLDNFAEDDWYGGFADYITTADEYMEMAVAGTPMNEENDPYAKAADVLITLIVVILIPIIVAGIVCFVFYGQMKPVKAQKSAANYIVGSVQYTDRSGRFSHATETRTPIAKDNNDGGGFSSGGGFSGKSGKF